MIRQMAVSTLFIVAVTIGLMLYLNKLQTDTLNFFAEQKLENNEVALNATLESLNTTSIKDFQHTQMDNRVLELLKEFNRAKPSQRQVIRGRLFRLLSPHFELMQQLDILQFHFITVEGKSLLRFHSPTMNGDSLIDLRKSIRTVTAQHKPIYGFEGGRVSPSFRHVYPLFLKGEFIGSLEISMGFEGIARQVKKTLGPVGVQFLINEENSVDKVFPHLVQNFHPSELNPSYFVKTPKVSELSASNQHNPLLRKVISAMAGQKQVFWKKMDTEQSFYQLIRLAGKSYIVTFVSIFDTQNQHAGYLAGVYEFGHYNSVQQQYFSYKSITLLVSMIITILLLLLIRFWHTKKHYQQVLEEQNHTLLSAQSIAHFGSMTIDWHNATSHWSPEVFHILGLDPKHDKPSDELLLKQLLSEDRVKFSKAMDASLQTGKAFHFEGRVMVAGTQKSRVIQINARHSFNAEGNLLKTTATMFDITKQSEALSLLKKFIDSLPAMAILTDGQKLSFANQAFYQFFDYLSLEDFAKDHPCLCERFIKQRQFFHTQGLSPNARRDWLKRLLTIPSRLRVVIMEDSTGIRHAFSVHISQFDHINFVVTFNDITLTIEEKLDLENRVLHDSLTDAFNREFLEKNMVSILHKHKKSNLKTAVIFFDIDLFKQVNDKFGHDVGDKVLKKLSDTVHQSLRNGDFFVRYGGEEFLVIAGSQQLEDAERIAENLRRKIEKIHFAEIPRITASFGVALHQPDETFEKTIKHADEQLYRAKESGRNQVRCHHS